MPEDEVYYNDEWMVRGWPEKIQKAQRILTYEIAGKSYPRIRYGDEREDWGADRRSCHDCRARRGEFHVPGCDIEQCPRCAGQALGCNCTRAGHS